MNQIVEVYVPRFSVNSHLLDPFRKIWDEPAHMPTGIYIVQIVCDTLLHWNSKTNSPHKHFVQVFQSHLCILDHISSSTITSPFILQGLHLINDLIKRNSDDVWLNVVIGKVFPNCLLIVAKTTDLSFASKKQEIVATLKLIFQAEVYSNSESLRYQQFYFTMFSF